MEISNITNIGDTLSPKFKASIDGILFNYIPSGERTGTKGSTFWSNSSNANVWKEGGDGTKWKSAVNAVDINWNKAQMSFNDNLREFTSTGDLLKYIQDLHDAFLDNEEVMSRALNDLNERIGNGGGENPIVSVNSLFNQGTNIASINGTYIKAPFINYLETLDLTINSKLIVPEGIYTLDEQNEQPYNMIKSNNRVLYLGDGESSGVYFEEIVFIGDAVYQLYGRGERHKFLTNIDYNSTLKFAERLGSSTPGEYTEIISDVYQTSVPEGNYLKIQTKVGDVNDMHNIYLPEAKSANILDGGIIEHATMGLMSVSDKEKLDSLTDSIATTSQKGLMSAADKVKLDSLELSYQNGILKLVSSSNNNGYGSKVNLAGISGGDVKSLNLTMNGTEYLYGNTTYSNSLNLFIYNNCTSRLNLIEVSISGDNSNKLYIVVEEVEIDGNTKYFIVSGPLSLTNNRLNLSTSSVSDTYNKWLISIGSEYNLAILRNLGLDNRVKAEIEISDPSVSTISPGYSSQITITSNISGNISMVNLNTNYCTYQTFKTSSNTYVVQINNVNQTLSNNIISQDTIKVLFTPTNYQQYQASEFSINNVDITIQGVSSQETNLPIYPITIDSSTKKLVENGSSIIYTNSNNASIIIADKRNSQLQISFNNEKTYYKDVNVINIDDFATGIYYDIDFYLDYVDESEDVTSLQIKLNNVVLSTYNYKLNTTEHSGALTLNEGNFKNRIIRVPSCGFAGIAKFEVFPTSLSDVRALNSQRIYLRTYNHLNSQLGAPGQISNTLSTSISEETTSDYLLNYSMSENTTSKFRVVTILVSTENVVNVNGINDKTALLCFILEPKNYRRIYYSRLSSYKSEIYLEDLSSFSSKVINGSTSIPITIDENVNKYDKIFVLVPSNVKFTNSFTNILDKKLNWDNLTYTIYWKYVLNLSNNFNLEFS